MSLIDDTIDPHWQAKELHRLGLVNDKELGKFDTDLKMQAEDLNRALKELNEALEYVNKYLDKEVDLKSNLALGMAYITKALL